MLNVIWLAMILVAVLVGGFTGKFDAMTKGKRIRLGNDWWTTLETFSPLARMSEGRIWGVLTDHLGIATELVAEDGALAWRGEIDSFLAVRGESMTTSCNLIGAGLYADADVDLIYNMNRYLSPDGHYISDDPIGLLGGWNVRRVHGDIARARFLSVGHLGDLEDFVSEPHRHVVERHRQSTGQPANRCMSIVDEFEDTINGRIRIR
jgi:hypothetical protein